MPFVGHFAQTCRLLTYNSRTTYYATNTSAESAYTLFCPSSLSWRFSRNALGVTFLGMSCTIATLMLDGLCDRYSGVSVKRAIKET